MTENDAISSVWEEENSCGGRFVQCSLSDSSEEKKELWSHSLLIRTKWLQPSCYLECTMQTSVSFTHHPVSGNFSK